jgi:plastocyanin
MKSRLMSMRNGILILCMVLILNGCSTPSEKPVPKTHLVEIKAMQFQPSQLVVQKGDTVIFTNKDIVVHDVTEEKNKSWTSLPLSTDQSYSMVVNESADYYCSIHPVMKGKLLME